MSRATKPHCDGCATYREIIADLRGLLAASEADRKQMTDRLLALMFPQALQVARGETRPASTVQTSGYDPEVGHERLVNGEEQLLGGQNQIDPREWSEMQDLLATLGAGNPSPDITDNGSNGHEVKSG